MDPKTKSEYQNTNFLYLFQKIIEREDGRKGGEFWLYSFLVTIFVHSRLYMNLLYKVPRFL